MKQGSVVNNENSIKIKDNQSLRKSIYDSSERVVLIKENMDLLVESKKKNVSNF